MITITVINPKFYQLYSAEQRIKSTKWAGCPAEWPTGNYRPNNEKDKNKYLE
jgi:hypothetical protein